jgi:hypothetical protein
MQASPTSQANSLNRLQSIRKVTTPQSPSQAAQKTKPKITLQNQRMNVPQQVPATRPAPATKAATPPTRKPVEKDPKGKITFYSVC